MHVTSHDVNIVVKF